MTAVTVLSLAVGALVCGVIDALMVRAAIKSMCQPKGRGVK